MNAYLAGLELKALPLAEAITEPALAFVAVRARIQERRAAAKPAEQTRATPEPEAKPDKYKEHGTAAAKAWSLKVLSMTGAEFREYAAKLAAAKQRPTRQKRPAQEQELTGWRRMAAALDREQQQKLS